MGRDIAITPAEIEDSVIMGVLMRGADAEESLAMGFASPREAVEQSIRNSIQAATVRTSDGILLGVFGLALSDNPRFAMPWMTITDEQVSRPVTMLKMARQTLDYWSQVYNLFNWVHEEHEAAKQFIEVLGFEIEEKPRDFATATGEYHRLNLFWRGEKPCVS